MLNIIFSGTVHSAYVARLRFFADLQLHIAVELKDVFQHSYAQGECQMNALVHVPEDDNEWWCQLLWSIRMGSVLKNVRGRSLLEIHSFLCVPEYVLKEPRKLRVTRVLTSE